MKINWKNVKEGYEIEGKYFGEIEKRLDSLANMEIENISVKGMYPELYSGLEQCIYNERELLKVFMTDKKRFTYFNLKGDFIEERTPSKKIMNTDHRAKTDLVEVVSIITGKALYLRKDRDKTYIDYSSEEIQCESDMSCVLGTQFVERHKYNKNVSYYSSTFNIELFKDSLPSYFVKNSETISVFDEGVYFENGQFFITYSSSKEKYDLPTYEHREVIYTLIENVVYYVSKMVVFKEAPKRIDTSFIELNTEYTKVANGLFWKIEDGKVKISDKPYSKYPRLMNYGGYRNESLLVVSENSWVLDEKDTKHNDGDIVVNDTEFAMTDYILKTDEIVPYGNKILIVRGDLVYLYHKAKYYFDVAKSGFEKYENIKFGRKKTKMYLDGTTLRCDGSVRSIDLKDYKIDTIKALSEEIVCIEKKDGETYLMSSYGNIVKQRIKINKKTMVAIRNDNIVAANETKGSVNIQLNDVVLILKDGVLSIGERVLVENCTFNAEEISIEAVLKDSVLDVPNQARLEYVVGKLSRIERGIDILEETDDIIQIRGVFGEQRATYVVSKVDSEAEIGDVIKVVDGVIDILEEVKGYNGKQRICRNIIVGGWILKNKDILRMRMIDKNIYDRVIDEIKNWLQNDNKGLERIEFDSMCKSLLNQELAKNMQEYGILNTENGFSNLISRLEVDKYFFNMAMGFSRIWCSIDNEELEKEFIYRIESDIMGVVKESEFAKLKKSVILKKAALLGVDYEKASSFNVVEVFTAKNEEEFRIKKSIENVIVGIYMELVSGEIGNNSSFLKINSIKDLQTLLESSGLNSDSIDVTHDISEAMRNINVFGERICKYWKECGVNSMERAIYINDKKISSCKFDEITGVINNIRDSLKAIMDDICSYEDKSGNDLRGLRDFIEWKEIQISKELKKIPTAIDEDIEPMQMEFSLVDSKNFIKSFMLKSGVSSKFLSRTNNRGRLENLTSNEEFVVQITNENNIIGFIKLAFVMSDDAIQYRFEEKQHVFMVIKECVLNKEYTKYDKSISMAFQKYAYKYLEFMKDSNISDVLLKAGVNNLIAPYDFVLKMNATNLGKIVQKTEEYLHRDSRKEFYKFI